MATAPTAARPAFVEVPHRGLITISIMLATIMQVLDTTIANVALPSMTGDLGASADTINWVLTSYIVSAAIMTPMTGWLSDRFGKRELFLLSVAGFVVTSVACGLSWNLSSMVTFRLLQGIFGAAIVPLSQTFLLDINPPERAGPAMAMWGAGIMVGPIIGPTLGGWLTEYYNWRWVFLVNLPVGIVAFAGCWAYLPESIRRPRPFDFFGFGALAVALGALQLMLDRGAEKDWFSSGEIWIYFFLTVSGFWIFVIHILGAKRPFLDPRMFKDRNFSVGLLFIFVVGIILLASLALLPPMLSRIFGYPVMTTGLVMAPRGVGSMISMILVGRLVRVVDPRILVSVGLLLTAYSLWMMTGFSPQMDARLIILSGIIQGLGLGQVFVPLSTVAFATIAPQMRADATSLFSLVRNIGSSIGISVVTVMLTRNLQVAHAEMAEGLTPFNPNFTNVLAAAKGQPLAQTMSTLDLLVSQQSLMLAYINDFYLLTWVTLAALPLVLLMSKPAPQSQGAGAPMAHAD